MEHVVCSSYVGDRRYNEYKIRGENGRAEVDTFVNCNWVVTLRQYYSTHVYTNNTWKNTNNNKTTQITTNLEECGPYPVVASFNLAFALQLRKKHGKT